MMSNNNNNMIMGQFGDTTLTKVFVGGLAWETPKEALRDHFEKYGDILEAVIICDKLTSRSKGYGFVTFKEPESAKRACEEATPMINGRRANCNLASLGARRPRVISTTPSSAQQGSNNGSRSATTSPVPANQVQWYYPTATPASPYHHAVPMHYGYSPTFIPADYSYNQKVNYTSGSHMNGHYAQQVYPGGQAGATTMVPVPYPYYHQFYQSQTMGVPAHVGGPISTVPTLISKPSSNTGITIGKQMVKDVEREA